MAADPGARVTGGRWARTVRGVGGVRGGMGSVAAMTFAIDHLDFFGLRQVGHYLRGLAQTPPAFRHPLPYRLVRHPMMAGFFPAFLATPTMTGGHLLFALLSCGYIDP